MLPVIAESVYPTITPSPRVRAAAFAPFLREHGIDLRFVSYVSDDEYRVLSSSVDRVGKACVIARGAGRVARRRRPPDALLMVHLLLSLVPVPGFDPPARVDVYDFDDALFAVPEFAARRGIGALKRERERSRAYLRRARLVLAGTNISPRTRRSSQDASRSCPPASAPPQTCREPRRTSRR